MQRGVQLILAAICLLLAPTELVAADPTLVNPDDCSSLECTREVERMASWMNRQVDPCRDFYEFACGGFENATGLSDTLGGLEGNDSSMVETAAAPDDAQSLATDAVNSRVQEVLEDPGTVNDTDPDVNRMYDFARTFFSSCSQWMQARRSNMDDFMPILLFSKGKTKLIRQEFSSTKTVNTEALFALGIRSGVKSLLNVKLSRTDLECLVTSLDLWNPRGFLFVQNKSIQRPHRISGYVKAEISLNPLLPPRNTSKFAKLRFSRTFKGQDYIDTFTLLNSSMSNDSWVAKCMAGYSSLEHRIKLPLRLLDQLSQCVNATNPFSWTKFFQLVLGQSFVSKEKNNLRILDLVSVVNMFNFFKSREGTDGQVAFRDAEFLNIDWELAFLDFSPKTKAILQMQREKNMNGYQHPTDISTASCVELAKRYLEPVVSRMYYQYVLGSEETANKANETDLRLIKAIEYVGNGTDWLRPSSKTHLPVNSLRYRKRHYIGFQNDTTSYLKKIYKPMLNYFEAENVTGELGAFGLLLTIAMRADWSYRFYALYTGRRFISVFDLVPSLTAEAVKIRCEGSSSVAALAIPLGVLAPPLLHISYPDYVTMGGIGLSLARRSSFLFFANQKWPIPQQSECLRQQYLGLYNGSFPMQNSSLEVDSLVNGTLLSFISDIIAIRVAFEAMARGNETSARAAPLIPGLELTSRQAFFVRAAQNYCSRPGTPDQRRHDPRVRVNGQLMSSRNFSVEFSCRAGSPMNPVDKCSLW